MSPHVFLTLTKKIHLIISFQIVGERANKRIHFQSSIDILSQPQCDPAFETLSRIRSRTKNVKISGRIMLLICDRP